MGRYSQGICGDGAAILYDGEMLTVDETVARLNMMDDLTALVARLAHSLRQATPDNDLPEKAVDYLRRKGLQGSPLRDVPNV